MEELGLKSRGYFLLNNDLGVGIGGREAETAGAVASLTKMMTALLAVEKLDLDMEVEITEEMVRVQEDFVVVGLLAGERASVRDLLYATMLPSAGDAAQALGIAASGSLEEFIGEMNARAEKLGMKNTHFENTVGYDDAGNYSTSRDMAILVREAIRNPKFLEVWRSFEQELPTIGVTAKKTFAQTSGITGGKTGFTDAAKRCLASTAEIEGTEYIFVSVGAEWGENIADAEKVYEWVREAYEPVEVAREGELVMRLQVRGSATEEIEVYAPANKAVALENGTTTRDLEYTYEGAQEITRKTAIGEKLGTLRVRKGETELYAQEVVYEGGVEFYNYGWCAAYVGGVATLAIGMIMAAAWRKKRGRRVRMRGIVARVMILAAIVAAGGLVFGPWFRETGKTEVVRPGEMMEEVSAEETEPGELGEETPEIAEGESIAGGNCTTGYGNLMLINPNFTVTEEFIAGRRNGLVSVSGLYGIPEYNRAGNGDNIMVPEAAEALSRMVAAYKAEYAGHEMGTYSCFRAQGTQCGRLCAATGTSDHHTGLTCDLIDLAYGSALETDDYNDHREWQWLRANSYKYGFIDRFPEEWAGGPMSEPLNVDENGSTGLYETWHYRYVGVRVATEIANGKYNNGRYDSLEHYLKTVGKVGDLKRGVCR